jgi:hypothetical protein
MLKRAIWISSAAACLSIGCGSADLPTEATTHVDDSVVRGTPVPVSDVPSVGRPYVVMVFFITFSGQVSACSGSYFAPRVVLTAAHCIPTEYTPQAIVYYGTDFAADTTEPVTIPPPGQPSVWANADSWEANPGFAVNYYDADLAVVYLDRKLPFDPLPLFRNRLDAAWTNKLATLVGWGANKALSEDTQENEGFGVKRTGKAPILGTPTLADYQPLPEEVPLLTPTVRGHNLKLNGKKPNANLCSGDSGGPIIVNQYGQDYVAGVASRTGAWCEDMSLYTRIDPYLPFLDEAYRKGGQAPLVPGFDCIDAWNGKQTAYFGYKNDNGINVSVPYGTKNSFPLDTKNQRPSLFKPGNNRFQFGIDIKAGQTLVWKLSPPNSPTTEVRATASSARCGASVERTCARYCQNILASECAPNFGATWDTCFNPCVEGYNNQFTGTSCTDEWDSYLNCVATTPPDAEHWMCEPNPFDYLPRALECDPLIDVALNCLYPPE